MQADKITVNDICGIGKGGNITVTLPSYKACIAAKNLVAYVQRVYAHEITGYSYYTRIRGNVIVIGLAETEKVKDRRRYKELVIK